MRKARRGAAAAAALVALCAALLPGQSASAADAGPPPEVLPALREWHGTAGEFTLTDRARIAVDARDGRTESDARRFGGTELTGHHPVTRGRARAGDVVLRQDPSLKGELGAEGYRISVGDRLTVTAATSTGVFYGTRTVLQLLNDDGRAARGSATDVPAYRERGVGVCACYIHVSLPWFERLMKDMASQKLNQLWIEGKVKSDVDPKTAFWGYYTKAEARQLAAVAAKYHIELIPEINSPGHMDPYLENHPELQLKDKDGTPSAPRLDISKPEALAYYTSLVDEAVKAWGAKQWHMGADEYMIGSAYPNYPQLQAEATKRFGDKASPDDLFADFINQVDTHVKAGGRTLRIWNDGLAGKNTVVPLDRDITVEHWTGGGSIEKPSALLAEGRPVMNSAYSLYLVRGGFTMNTQKLYDSDWTPLRFEDETLTGRPANLTGAKISLWPDSAAAETENEVEAKTFMPLRFLAQATWGGPKPAATYAGFETLARTLGHAPDWANTDRTPVADGTYRLTAPGAKSLAPAAGSGVALVRGSTAAWTATATTDGYYTLKSAESGQCLDATRGKRYLGAPLEVGAELSAGTCSATARTQRWQLEPAGNGHGHGVVIRNAISQLAVGERETDGAAVQSLTGQAFGPQALGTVS
ncbi:family 20 glycosylhydrolase [Streptomyces beijiangensis]|uniref:Family 20 glycosylhydrolase n=1 Tax=Streptomyces beijiangensis TaxID=163361 RepID=A0A939F6F6_9ACTN|nr:family 20 glycosylhydrolase [Streptomyces beijiangensis]MBO0511260.1 family 20 glycosylhydrolase [Streptomyces beijiangensis]